MRHRPFGPRETFSLPDDPTVRFVAIESRLARLLYWYGGATYEGAETLWWQRLCATSTSILELGANIGYYTVRGALAAPEARYVAVEANPEAAGIVRANLELNALETVEIVEAAVADGNGPAAVELRLPDQEQYTAPTGAYVSDVADEIEPRPAGRTVIVPTVDVTTLLAGVDLVKLDIEGSEAKVLRAAFPILTRSRPTLVLEILPDARQLRAVVLELHDVGYVVFAIGDKSLHLLSRKDLASSHPLPRYGSRDVILVPAERADLL